MPAPEDRNTDKEADLGSTLGVEVTMGSFLSAWRMSMGGCLVGGGAWGTGRVGSQDPAGKANTKERTRPWMRKEGWELS